MQCSADVLSIPEGGGPCGRKEEFLEEEERRRKEGMGDGRTEGGGVGNLYLSI